MNEPARYDVAVALPREYTAESCPIARSLEIVGERWTLLVVRDAFYGVRRFSDFRAHLGIPKAVLAERLSLLVDEGVFAKAAGGGGRDEYVLTPKGRDCGRRSGRWPVGATRTTSTDHTGAAIGTPTAAAPSGQTGRARQCGQLPDVADLVVHPPRRPARPRRARRRRQHGPSSAAPDAGAHSPCRLTGVICLTPREPGDAPHRHRRRSDTRRRRIT